MPRTLFTSRLILRPFTELDIEPAYQVLESEAQVWQYDPGYQRTYEDRAAIIRRYAADNEPEGCGALAVTLKGSGELLGYVGLQLYVLPGEPYATPECELMYKFGRHYWGSGYATEACREMLRFAFDEMRLKRIVSITPNGNQRSVRLLQRLGMRIEPAPPAWSGMVMGVLDHPVTNSGE